ncbi:pyruvate dehydrogenase complex E1 component subunit beta [Roseivivax sp. CAU 1753]
MGHIRMPEVVPGLTEARLVCWLVAPGDLVEDGDLLAEIATDRAVFEIEAPGPGRIGALLVAEGTRAVAVGTAIATLQKDDAGETADRPGAEASAARSDPRPAPRPAAALSSPPATGAATGPLVPNDWPEGTATRQMSVRDALCAALDEEMRLDPSVFVIGDGVAAKQGSFTVTQGLIDSFGDRRVVDAPPVATALAGLAVGAAFAGLRPVVSFPSFGLALQAIDQIVNSAAKSDDMTDGTLSVPVVFRGPHGGGAQSGAQRAQDVAAWFAHVPGLKVAMPYAASDAKGLLKAAIRDPGPVVLLENESLYGRLSEVPDSEGRLVPLGRARVWRSGTDVTLVSFGIGMVATLEAADLLARDGIAAEVIDLRSLRPLDTATLIASVRDTGRCVTVEQGWPQGGIGQQVAAALMAGAFDRLKAPVCNVAALDMPRPYAAGLEAAALPAARDIVAAVTAMLTR